MTLNGVMAVTLRYFTEFGKPALYVAEFIQESVVFLVRVQCRRNESSRSLSHLLMSFLSSHGVCYSVFQSSVFHFQARVFSKSVNPGHSWECIAVDFGLLLGSMRDVNVNTSSL